MKIDAVIQSMRRRMPWEVAQKALMLADAPRGMGWERTIAKFADPASSAEDFVDPLTEALREHERAGEKLVRFYRLALPEMKKLRDALLKHTVTKSVFTDSYPGLLSEAELKAHAPQPHQLVAIETCEDGVAATFCSIRVVLIREPVTPSSLPAAAASALADYDQVFGYRQARLQAFDTVWVPHAGDLVDVRVDYPTGLGVDVAETAASHTRSALAATLGHDYLAEEVNVFPLIRRIYKEAAEGTIVELGFETGGASRKHETMRRKSLCLRDEVYHRAGATALKGEIEPYLLSVQWPRRYGKATVSRPELTFHGTARTAESGVMTDVVIRKCIGDADYEHVRSRIEHHLTAMAAEAAAGTSHAAA